MPHRAAFIACDYASLHLPHIQEARLRARGAGASMKGMPDEAQGEGLVWAHAAVEGMVVVLLLVVQSDGCGRDCVVMPRVGAYPRHWGWTKLPLT